MRLSGSRRRRLMLVLGTRPEAIKLAPVVCALRARRPFFDSVVVSTGQHREMLDQVLGLFGLVPDRDLDLMRPGQGLSELTGRVLTGIDQTLREVAPDLVIVQGDTTTAFATALAAFHRRVPVAHVEAGLRSADLANPFPEEANRRLTGVIADVHLAPTALARQNLLDEGVSAASIVVTGNTVVDALHTLLERSSPLALAETPVAGIPFDEGPVVLVTSHRRESWGPQLESICAAIRDLVDWYPDLRVVYPVHLNPAVRGTVEEKLGGTDRIHLTPPLDYVSFVHLMRRVDLILTDSGGVQEEAPSLGTPVIVLRSVTERPEAAWTGLSKVIGTSREEITLAAADYLDDGLTNRRARASYNPFGDGRASERICEALCRWADGVTPLLLATEEFGFTETRKVA